MNFHGVKSLTIEHHAGGWTKLHIEHKAWGRDENNLFVEITCKSEITLHRADESNKLEVIKL